MTLDLPREQVIGIACALVVVFLWSGFLVLSRHGASRTMTPYDLTALRFGVAGLIMLPFLIRNGFGGLKSGQVTVLTLTGGPVFALLVYGGFSLAPVSHGAVLLPGTLPLFTAVLSVVLIKEPLGKGRIFCLAIILAGVGLIAKDSLTYSEFNKGWGDALFLFGSISWSSFTVLLRAWRLTPFRATAIVSVLSMVAYVPVYAWFLPSNFLDAPLGEVFLQGIYQGFFSVIVALLAYTRAVATLGPAVTTMITAAVPGTAALAAIPILHEPLSLISGAGLSLVTLGMVGAVASVRKPKAGSSSG